MKIGELALATDTPVETIRFYEREGLLPTPGRSAANYRQYEEAHVQRLVFIRRCRKLDMALDEVRALLRFSDQPGADCGEVNQVLDEHIGHVAARIEELRALETELRQLRARCAASGSGLACAILQALNEPASAPPRARRAAGKPSHLGTVHGRKPGATP